MAHSAKHSAKRCPTCKQILNPAPTRLCFDCGNPIFRHDKYTSEPRGPDGIKTTVHRNCSDPTSYI